MSKKKVLAIGLAILMSFSLMGCGEGKNAGDITASEQSSDNVDTQGDNPEAEQLESQKKNAQIQLLNNKIEIDEGIKAAAVKYQELNPGITIEVVSMTAEPYDTDLKTKFAGGAAPDIFAVSGNSQMLAWESHLEDLTDQPWVTDMLDIGKPGITKDGKIYGMPICVEGGGYMYNKDMFEKAGITEIPKTKTAFKDALQKLSDAGYTPLIEDSGWYGLGYYFVNYGFANQEEPMAYIDGLNNGTKTITGDPKFTEMAEYFLWESTQCTNMMGIDFNTQVSMMANQEVGITFGGNWNQLTFDEVDPDLPIGLMPVPITEDAEYNDFLLAGVTNYWVVNKDSAVKQEAKDFMTWLVTDPEGQKFITKDMALIPAFSSFEADNESIGALGTDLAGYIANGKIKGFYASFYPDGGTQTFGEDMQKLVAGKAGIAEFLETLQSDWERLAE